MFERFQQLCGSGVFDVWEIVVAMPTAKVNQIWQVLGREWNRCLVRGNYMKLN